MPSTAGVTVTGWTDASLANQIGQPLVNGNDFVGRAGQRPEQQKIFLVARQEHPFTTATFDDGTRSHGVAAASFFIFVIQRMSGEKRRAWLILDNRKIFSSRTALTIG
jgi:hypothetical protein